MKVLMVCLGNICRSPLAEGILRHKAAAANKSIEVDSCGTGGWHVGEKADPRSRQKSHEHGIDIDSLRARQFHPSDFETFDLIYCMDESNYHDIVALAENQAYKAKVKLILNEVPNLKFQNVPDPYYGGADGFETVYQMLDKACDAIIDRST
ncbi:MAG: low molecular weight phosphotyrosine protein phosphatase [Flavobacteriales bacterium]|nr:low molecular weight phosphotyrosine protein phosphatase [Flavobacteriales bacterium]